MATKSKNVIITLPEATKGEPEFITVSLNGKTYQINRGEPVELPIEVAEIIRNGERAKKKARSYISIQSKN